MAFEFLIHRQLTYEVMSEPVNWIADMGMAKFFYTMPHVEILALLSERIADQRFLRLIARMLKADAQTPEGLGGGEASATASAVGISDSVKRKSC